MSSESLKSKFKEMNMTREEIDRLSEALKKEEFRKLLVEYAEEISDPANRQLYEREISKLEEERGMNVTFIHPEPGYCVKTSQTGAVKKCFVNICKNEHIEKPMCKRDGAGVGSGAYWQIPHSCSPARDDLDASQSCVVYDVVFNPDAYRMGETNQRFNKLLIDSAFETIENNFHVKLDKVNFKVLKNIKFKGKPTACVIRKTASASQTETAQSKPQSADVSPPADDDSIGRLIDQLKDEYLQEQTKANVKPEPKANVKAESKAKSTPVEEENYVKPEYKLVHRGHIDLQDYVSGSQGANVSSTRPKELIVTVELPLCRSSDGLIVDIFEKRLYLESSKPNYRLDLPLPYPISEKEARAKFDKSRRCLNVTLPVVPFVAKLDIVNVDHLTDEEDSSSSSLTFSPSSSSSSDSNLDLVSGQIEKRDVLYKLPGTIGMCEYRDHVLLTITAPNYRRETLQLKLVSPGELKVQFESVSRSAYTQYYLMYVTFTHQDQKLNILSEEEQPRPIYVDEDTFQVLVKKSHGEPGRHLKGKKALISSEHADEQLDLNNNEPSKSKPIIVDVDEASSESEFRTPSEQRPVPTEEMSKRDFILNFDKMARNDDQQDDEDDVVDAETNPKEEEDDDDEEQDTQTKSKFKNLSEEVKLAREKFVKSGEIKKQQLKDEENDDANDSHSDSDDDEEPAHKPTFDLNCDGVWSRSSSISNFTNDSQSTLSSSLNSASFSKIKGILKKPRSYSESENNLTSMAPHERLSNRHSFSGTTDANNNTTQKSSCQNESNECLSASKKSVSFSKQVIRNIFKPGSTISGMKKPNSNKNKKKNKRKRTISDPSHDDSNCSGAASQPPARSRSVSDSIEDMPSATAPSKPAPLSKADFTKDTPNNSAQNGQKKNLSKKKKKSNNNANTKPEPETNCAFKFKNKIVNDLDD